MAAPFITPNRNAGYQAAKLPYENQWVASARDYKLKQEAANAPPKKSAASKPSQQLTPEPSQNAELKELAKKSTKQVREWFKDQVDALDDSSED